jgi:2-amino-4-hydroxy-6-hydroxymethyldihydropteridine diphosphokinase
MELPLSEQMTMAPDQPIVPHPRLQDRAFVLGPLMDIAPQWCHPVLGQTIAEIYAATPQNLKDEVKPL